MTDETQGCVALTSAQSGLDPLLEEIKSRLNYCPISGRFTWTRGRRAGHRAGSINGEGYLLIRFTLKTGEKLQIYGHRLAWAMTFDRWPAEVIDHRNRNRLDNRVSNLREACPMTNSWNNAAKGYYQHKATGLFHACIKSRGVKHSLGYHRTETEARAAYLSAKEKHHNVK